MLPDGQRVFCHRKREALSVFDQVRQYFQYGIEVHKGDIVFDVGANIGLFSLLVNELCEGDVQIYAFEPIPATCEILGANTDRYARGKVEIINSGVAAESGNTEFAYYPNFSVLSTAHHGHENEDEVREQLKQSILRNLDETPYPLKLIRFLPVGLRSSFLDRITKKSLEEVQIVDCKLEALSDIIERYDIGQIDLLKVDAEKSELEVLEGIGPEHWSRIKQVVMELHDLEGRLETVRQLLIKNGLIYVHVEQEPALKGSNIYAVFASRQKLNPQASIAG